MAILRTTPRSLLQNLKTGLRHLFRKDQVNGELDEELQSFLQAAVEDNLRSGMSAADAERAARVTVGSAAAVKDQVHAAGWESHLETLFQDVRYGLRTLRNQPGFTVVAVLTLALGIGVNTGIYTILNAAALKPLPSPRPAEIIGIYQTFTGKFSRSIHGAGGYSSFYEYQQYRANNHLLAGVMAYAYVPATLGGEKPRELIGTLATCDYFNVLEVRMAMGRAFSASDCAAAGAGPVVILTCPRYVSWFSGWARWCFAPWVWCCWWPAPTWPTCCWRALRADEKRSPFVWPSAQRGQELSAVADREFVALADGWDRGYAGVILVDGGPGALCPYTSSAGLVNFWRRHNTRLACSSRRAGALAADGTGFRAGSRPAVHAP